MDRAMKNLLARVFGALALGAYFIHVGMHLAGLSRVGAGAWAVVALFLVGGVAASWAQARLNAKRAAVWTALVLLGVVPMGAWALHRAPVTEPFGVVLGLGLVFGAATTVMCAWILAESVVA